MIRRPPRSTRVRSSAASDVYKRQVWDDHADFERYWYSDEITALREAALNYFNKPLSSSWHTLVVDASPVEAAD